jgi:glycosyltransferase involved in cell wall biosynthesis
MSGQLNESASKATMREQQRRGICLNMIVKNEIHVLGRLLKSVKDHIDYYVIVDTGSTDGTPEFIKEQMDHHGIPGEVHCREWVNFGANRNEALQLACAADKCDWVLLIDADEELGCSDPGFFRQLQSGITYELEKHQSAMRYALPNLIDIRNTQWKWTGAVHEYLDVVSGCFKSERCKDAWIIYHEGEGARSLGITKEMKFLRDALVLEDELRKDPNSSRDRFYLAQSYRDAGKIHDAYNNYRIRAAMQGGWDEETFMAQFEAGKITRVLGAPHGQVIEGFLVAYNLRPTRAEPLYELAQHCRSLEHYGQAYIFAKMASLIPLPLDILFVKKDIYEWRIVDELAIAAYWVGKYEESRDLCEKLLQLAAEGCSMTCQDLLRIKENLRHAEVGCGSGSSPN